MQETVLWLRKPKTQVLLINFLPPSIMSQKKFRVLVSDSVDRAGIEILRSVAEVDIKTKLPEDQICEIIGDYDALVVRSGTQVTERIIQAGRKLKIIGRAGVGVDNVDVGAATSKGIYVVNSPQGNTIAAAEHTLALMFAVARNIPAADSSLRSGKWEREKFMGGQLQHKTIGIVGLGQVGSHVAKVCREMGMDLIVYDPYVNVTKAVSLGCRVVELDELVSEADIITLHVPLIPETKHLINEERLRLMKQSTVLVNCSRGGVVDETALCSALKEGRLGGAALDVFEVEGKMDKNSPLLSAPNLVLTPHLGASTREAQVNVAVDVAQQIRQTLQGNLPDSAVNIPGVSIAELANLRPLMECCEMLGRVSMQLLTGPLEQITVVVEGVFASVDKAEPLLMAAANGAIGVHTATRVNFVNVRQIAESHRIKMVLVKDEDNMKNAISVDVRSGTNSAHIRGTVTEENDVLLKAFDDVPVYMVLPTSTSRTRLGSSTRATIRPEVTGGTGSSTTLDVDQSLKFEKSAAVQMIYTRHDDVPGVLAAITAALGDAGVNIANCHLGRERVPGTVKGSALSIFHIDGECPSEVVDELKRIEAVRVCKILTV